MRPFRVACLVSHPIQYQAPLFRRLAREERVDLDVFFHSYRSVGRHLDRLFGVEIDWNVPLLDGYEHRALGGDGPGRESKLALLSRLDRALARGGYDALWIHGYANLTHLLAMGSARRHGMKVLLRGDAHRSSRPRSAWAEPLRRAVLRRVFGAADALLAVGTLNADYYRSHGASTDKIFSVPYVVDNSFFRDRAEVASSARPELRAALGLRIGRPVVLYVGRLAPEKRPGDLLEAVTGLPAAGYSGPDPYCLFVGDGPLRPELEASAADAPERVRFLGFRDQTELPALYDLCDVFVLPSEWEPWGLAVNEAMNAGKPLVLSERVGCASDLLTQGVNGYTFPVGDTDALARRIAAVLEDRMKARRMGRESLALIQCWNLDAFAQGFMAALERVTERRTQVRFDGSDRASLARTGI